MDFHDFLTETKFAKVLNALRGDTPHINQMGIMTAQNPLGAQSSPEENNNRNRELLMTLRRANFRGWPVNPQWIMGKFGNIEDSYFIPHIDRTTLVGLGARFGQQSVIWGQKQHDDKEGDFVRFEYIGTEAKEMPVDPSSYHTVQTRDVVLSGPEASQRDDNFSAKPFPRSGVDKRSGQPATGRKFVIPFFDDRYGKAKYGDGKRRVDGTTEDIIPDLSFLSSQLPDTERVRELVEEIRLKEEALYTEGKVPHWYWNARGSLEVSLAALRELVR